MNAKTDGRAGGPALRALGALDGAVASFEAVALALGVAAMAAISVANVVGRFLLGQSIFFTEEVNQFLVVMITFLGIGYAARNGRHIRMTAIYDTLPDSPRKALMVVICLTTATFMFVLAWLAWAYVAGLVELGRIAPALGVPVWWGLVWMPLGFVITGLQYVLTAVANLTRPEVYVSTDVVDTYDDDEPTPV